MIIEKYNSLNGECFVPGDKSISHRAVMFGAICDGVSPIYGFLQGADCLATIDCFKKLGVKIEVTDDVIKVYGVGMNGLKKPNEVLYTANSGTTTRLISGILSAQAFDVDIDGDSSIRKRPMARITKPLSMMGANFSSDYCPLKIKGNSLKGIKYNMPMASAQVKSSIILAGLYADGTTTISEPQKSRDHTERMLMAMGANIEVDDKTVIVNKTSKLLAQDINVPGDISSAAFLIVAALIMPNSCITIRNVGINPTRSGIIDVLLAMDANIKLENEREVSNEPVADIVVKSSLLKATVVEGDIIPRLIDEIPIIAVASAFASGATIIRDAQELKVKESNRIDTVTNELKKCGVDIKATDDGMIITGGVKLNGADFKSYDDHRIAMAEAVIAQCVDGQVTIDNVDCVDVSYPDFFDTLKKLCV